MASLDRRRTVLEGSTKDLHDWCLTQRAFKGRPPTIVLESVPGTAQIVAVVTLPDGREFRSGEHGRKKDAEQEAAAVALQETRHSYAKPIECARCSQLRANATDEHLCRFLGTFCCAACNLVWRSGWTWDGEQQQCRRCAEWVTAASLDSLDEFDPASEMHDTIRCSKCQSMGIDCSTLQ